MALPALPSPESLTHDDEILTLLAACENRPYDFAVAMFPWGEEGTELEHMTLEDWQVKVLRDLQANLITVTQAIKIAMKSGHDVGKSALMCIIILWAFSTKTDTRGRVTANTETQLRTTLWVELSKWFQLFLGKQFFTWTSTRMCSADPAKALSWRVDAVQWSIDNPTAFAGLHNFGKRLIYVMDEAAKIPDIIWEVVDGTMREANTQLIWVVACQPIFNTGRFYECWHKFSDSWNTYTVDSREVRMCNQDAVAQEIKDRGGDEDDVVRVRIRGLFPKASAAQFISRDVISAAQSRPRTSQPWEPLILGVDIGRRGNSNCVASFRRGRDAVSIPFRRWRPNSDNLATIESGNIIAELITTHSPDAVFLDATGYGAGVADFVRSLGFSATSIDFGSGRNISVNGINCHNMRAAMYVRLKDWLIQGGVISSDPDLTEQLLNVMYGYNDLTGALKLMAKEDMRTLGIPSPDDTDALALTFAYPVANKRAAAAPSLHKSDYDPLSHERCVPPPTSPAPPKFIADRSCFAGFAERRDS